MTLSRAQSVANADRDLRQYLIRIAATLGDALGDALSGLYVHGSLATGSFHRERSDIDLIAITSRKLTPAERERSARSLVKLSDERPLWGDIEATIVAERAIAEFVHPLPYEVRYDSGLHERIRHGRIDFARDESSVNLASKIVEVRERGVTLVGAPPDRAFGPVPWYAYVDALRADFESAQSRSPEKPVYGVLGACRVLYGATSTQMRTLNKDEAATWALRTVPERYHAAIRDALHVYRGTKSIEDVVFARSEVDAFRDYVRERSMAAFERASGTGEST